MKYVSSSSLIAGVVIAVASGCFRRRRRRGLRPTWRPGAADGAGPVEEPGSRSTGATPDARPGAGVTSRTRFGDVGMVAMREIKERVRGRIFRVGTLIILARRRRRHRHPDPHTAAAGPDHARRWASSARLSPEPSRSWTRPGRQNQDSVKLRAGALARRGQGRPAFGKARPRHRRRRRRSCSTSRPRSTARRPTPASSQDVAEYLGVLKAYQAAGLTADQAAQVTSAKPVPVHTLQPGSKSTTKATSVIGLVLLFVMLTQYSTWILIGVMQEKSSRVVEVLLATVRPIQLLGGKVLGIGLVALGQATAHRRIRPRRGQGRRLRPAARHRAAGALGCELLWLVLGYAFYCWVYAAAGSTAERQDQVQTLAFPLSIPILFGYIFSITVASSGNAGLLFKVLAYLPPTAPFGMPVLVALSE